MPAPFPIADQRATADAFNNANYAAMQSLPLAGLQNSSVVATAALNTTETILATLSLLPGQTLRAGSRIRAIIQGTSTSTAANTTTFAIRMGTAGTVADASVVTWATAAAGTTGTAVPFHAEIDFVIRTLGASGTGAGSMVLTANAATAIGGAVTNVVASTSASVPTTTATFLELTHVTAATTTTNTIQNVTLEVQP